MRLKLHVALLVCVVGTITLCAQSKATSKSFLTTINQKLDFAVKQEIKMAESVKDRPGKFPVTLDKNGNLALCDTTSWTCGFFPGTLWYLYGYSKNEQIKQHAKLFSDRLEGMQNATNTHDIGFIVYCSYGNGYRLTGDADYKAKIIRAAQSLCTRFSPVTGCIKSWDRGAGVYPVIIDNMMNLELLFEAYKLTGNSKFREVAVAHANTTMKNHFRNDASCYHVVFYDPVTGKVKARKTRQGFADESSWSRGQAWALYGYTMCYRETKDVVYLHQAQKIAAFILNHPRLPKDKIPYWDFDDTKIPNVCRDASAGAVISSALIELSQYVSKDDARKYLNVAKVQLQALSSPVYLAQDASNRNFLLKHSVGSMPDNMEVDVPLPYADYYYLEALIRYRKLLNGASLFK
ncbi:MAG: glycoside hydrolase family 88 protein [Bacteroidota bacterium]|nr:glycoside hydrolase family 88 protein [Bacteroidota bacterium]MDP4268500.1 glycoside hydrolase family 88 protein [Bacteroidota bacterium]